MLLLCCLVPKSCLTVLRPHGLESTQALSIGSHGLQDWSGLPFPSPRDLPRLGIQLVSPALAGRFFTAEPLGKPLLMPCRNTVGTSLAVQWLRLHAAHAGGLGPVPGQGTRCHVLQLRAGRPQLKVSPAAMKTRHRQINKKRNTKKRKTVDLCVSVLCPASW